MAVATITRFCVVDAEGHHGDYLTVWYSSEDEYAARAFARSGGCRVLAGCEHSKGDKIPRGAVADMISAGFWRVI